MPSMGMLTCAHTHGMTSRWLPKELCTLKKWDCPTSEPGGLGNFSLNLIETPNLRVENLIARLTQNGNEGKVLKGTMDLKTT